MVIKAEVKSIAKSEESVEDDVRILPEEDVVRDDLVMLILPVDTWKECIKLAKLVDVKPVEMINLALKHLRVRIDNGLKDD